MREFELADRLIGNLNDVKDRLAEYTILEFLPQIYRTQPLADEDAINRAIGTYTHNIDSLVNVLGENVEDDAESRMIGKLKCCAAFLSSSSVEGDDYLAQRDQIADNIAGIVTDIADGYAGNLKLDKIGFMLEKFKGAYEMALGRGQQDVIARSRPPTIVSTLSESRLLNIAPCWENMDVELNIGDAKQRVRDDNSLVKFNDYIDLGSAIQDGDIFVYPVFSPSESIQVRITGYKRVLADSCTLVRAEYNGKPFVFFEPDSMGQNYDGVVGQLRDVKLAAVSTGRASNVNSDELSDKPSQKWAQEAAEKGFVHVADPIFYKTIFDVIGKNDQSREFVNLSVKNPLDKGHSMELVTNTRNFTSPQDTRQVVCEFYFIGYTG